MSHAWPYLLMVLILGGLLVFSMRSQRRKAAEQMARVSRMQLGSEVMTTSGLYGTIVHRNADGDGAALDCARCGGQVGAGGVARRRVAAAAIPRGHL